jgi:hypothetical protein
MFWAASIHFQRSAIGSAVSVMIATARANHAKSALRRTSAVLWMSIFHTR